MILACLSITAVWQKMPVNCQTSTFNHPVTSIITSSQNCRMLSAVNGRLWHHRRIGMVTRTRGKCWAISVFSRTKIESPWWPIKQIHTETTYPHFFHLEINTLIFVEKRQLEHLCMYRPQVWILIRYEFILGLVYTTRIERCTKWKTVDLIRQQKGLRLWVEVTLSLKNIYWITMCCEQ